MNSLIVIWVIIGFLTVGVSAYCGENLSVKKTIWLFVAWPLAWTVEVANILRYLIRGR